MDKEISKLIKKFDDPDELTDTVSRDLITVVYTAHADARTFHFEMDSAKTGDMMVWSTQSDSGYRAVADVTDNITFEFVDQGDLRYLPEGSAEVHAHINQLSVSRRSRAHTIICAPGTIRTVAVFPWERYVKLVAAEVKDPVEEFKNKLPVISLTSPEALFMKRLASLLQSAGESKSALNSAPLAANLLKEAFLETFVAWWPQYEGRARFQQLPRPWHVKRAVDWIYAHLDEKILLEDLAVASGASIRTLQLGFRQQFGLTPIGFIRRARLQRVHHELQIMANDATVWEIASRWGFSHQGEFAARYKALYGCLPSATKRASAV